MTDSREQFRELFHRHEPDIAKYLATMREEFPELKLKKLYCPVKNEILRTVPSTNDSALMASAILQAPMLQCLPSSTGQGTQSLGVEQ